MQFKSTLLFGMLGLLGLTSGSWAEGGSNPGYVMPPAYVYPSGRYPQPATPPRPYGYWERSQPVYPYHYGAPANPYSPSGSIYPESRPARPETGAGYAPQQGGSAQSAMVESSIAPTVRAEPAPVAPPAVEADAGAEQPQVVQDAQLDVPEPPVPDVSSELENAPESTPSGVLATPESDSTPSIEAETSIANDGAPASEPLPAESPVLQSNSAPSDGVFDSLDRNADGYLSVAEAQTILRPYWEQLDNDRDRYVSRQEFRDLYHAK